MASPPVAANSNTQEETKELGNSADGPAKYKQLRIAKALEWTANKLLKVHCPYHGCRGHDERDQRGEQGDQGLVTAHTRIHLQPCEGAESAVEEFRLVFPFHPEERCNGSGIEFDSYRCCFKAIATKNSEPDEMDELTRQTQKMNVREEQTEHFLDQVPNVPKFCYVQTPIPGKDDLAISVYSLAYTVPMVGNEKTFAHLAQGPSEMKTRAVSGWAGGKYAKTDGCLNRETWTNSVFIICKAIGHELQTDSRDDEKEGHYYASHAEKQLIAHVLGERQLRYQDMIGGIDIQVSREICPDCERFRERVHIVTGLVFNLIKIDI